jgi:hypothetical protein
MTKVNIGEEKSMNHLARTVLFICVAISGNIALSQPSACANPNATRIALVILNQPATNDPASSPQLVALSKRLIDADVEFRDQLAQRLPAKTCIVTSLDVFEDPKNFPQLKGSPIIEISAEASSKNPGVFALAVTVSSAGGINAQDNFQMFTIPVLIETDFDYARGADGFMKFWHVWVETATRGRNR